MRYFDYVKAKQLIESAEAIISASLGMHEDWFWTAEEVWAGGEWKRELFLGDLPSEIRKVRKLVEDEFAAIPEDDWESRMAVREKYQYPMISGICGSGWATPTLCLEYADGTSRMIPVFMGEKAEGWQSQAASVISNFGVLSGPAQTNIQPLEPEAR
jgi:hypothetical protein